MSACSVFLKSLKEAVTVAVKLVSVVRDHGNRKGVVNGHLGKEKVPISIVAAINPIAVACS